jgi:hypothetical protein
MESEKKLRRYLKARIKEEGYPLELEISDIFDRKNDWIVHNNKYFFDDEFKIGRTIDIEAVNQADSKISKKMNPFFSVCRIPIECKKSSSHAWVFFSRPHKSFGNYLGQQLDFLQILTGMEKFCSRFFLDVRDKPCLHYTNYKRVAVGYKELQFDKSKTRSKPSSILKASSQLMKYISYHNQRIKKTKLVGWSGLPFYFYFPVVLFEGKMYEYYEKSGKKFLVPVDRVLLESSYYPNYHYRDVSFAIEIVTKESFEALLKDVEKDCSVIYSGIVKSKEFLVNNFSNVFPPNVIKDLFKSTKITDSE